MSVMANDLRQFDGDIQAFNAAYRQLSTEYANLLSNMQALGSMWTGEGHDALDARFAGDYQQLGAIVEHFGQMAQALGSASQLYASCERDVRAIIEDLEG